LFFGSKWIIPIRNANVIPDNEVPYNYTSELYYADLYDAEGNCVFSETITRNNEIVQGIPPELDGIIRDSIVIEGIPGGIDGRRGISSLANTPVILAGYTLTHGNQSDTPAGTLVMARLLDEERIGALNQMLQIDVTL
jgi:sensor domain CHASE-containing protein